MKLTKWLFSRKPRPQILHECGRTPAWVRACDPSWDFFGVEYLHCGYKHLYTSPDKCKFATS